MKKFLFSFLSIVVVVSIDQYSKFIIANSMFHGESISVIPGFFSITFVKNTGVAFGIGAGAGDLIRRVFFLFFPMLVSAFLLFLIWKIRNKSNCILQIIAYTMIVAGAVGNVIDRFFLGYVVDFLDFYLGNTHFPVFNVADSFITIAAGILIIDYFIDLRERRLSSDCQ